MNWGGVEIELLSSPCRFDLGKGDTLSGDDGPQSLGYSSVITTQSAPSLQRTKSLGPYDR